MQQNDATVCNKTLQQCATSVRLTPSRVHSTIPKSYVAKLVPASRVHSTSKNRASRVERRASRERGRAARLVPAWVLLVDARERERA